MSKTETLCFYTLGPEFTTLLRDLWRDKAHVAVEILLEGGAPLPLALDVLTGKQMLVGDSRDKDGMSFGPDSLGGHFASLEETHQRLTHQYVEDARQYFLWLARVFRPMGWLKEYTKEELDENATRCREVAEHQFSALTKFCSLTGLPTPSAFPDLNVSAFDYEEEEGEPPHVQSRKPGKGSSIYHWAAHEREKRYGSILDSASPAQLRRLGISESQPDAMQAAVASQLGIDPKFLSLDRVLAQAQEEPYTLAPRPLLDSPYESGYIDRAGQLYGCGDRFHKDFAPILCEHLGIEADAPGHDPDAQLCRAGLVKFSMERFLYYPKHGAGLDTPSGEQVDVMVAWANAHGEDGNPGMLQYNGPRMTVAQFLEQIRP